MTIRLSKDPAPTLTSTARQRPVVTTVGTLKVSDNGENVVVFGPRGFQADFGWSEPSAVRALIERMGVEAFVARTNRLSHVAYRGTLTVGEYGDLPTVE